MTYIHSNDKAFSGSCSYGHLETAKWLYSLGGIDIHADNDFAILKSHEYNQLEVIKWLCSICDKYHYDFETKVMTIDK